MTRLRRSRAAIALAYVLSIAAACAPAVPHATNVDVARAAQTRPQTTLDELERGRSLYVARCGNCHRPYPPANFAANAWPAHVDGMAERAKLADADRALVLLFLVTLATR